MQTDLSNQRQSAPARSGVTIVEVLVAIGIVGVLMAILLPAIQFTREARRRTQCASNLRQAMIAQHQYLDIHGVFPGIEGVFHTRILEFIEIPQGIDFNKTPLFVCPADPVLTGEFRRPWFSSYFGNMGLTRDGYRRTGDGLGTGDGFMGGVRITPDGSSLEFVSDRDITDGLSTTAAVSERLALPDFYRADVDWNDYPQLWGGLILLTETRYDDLAAMADDCEFRAGPPRVRQVQTQHYNHILPPNHNSCTNGRPFDRYSNFPLTAGSLHPHGVNLALADGSVRFVSESISRDVWWALGTRSGGEPVSLGEQ